eukprot:954493-Rhodomonas_salina.1
MISTRSGTVSTPALRTGSPGSSSGTIVAAPMAIAAPGPLQPQPVTVGILAEAKLVLINKADKRPA